MPTRLDGRSLLGLGAAAGRSVPGVCNSRRCFCTKFQAGANTLSTRESRQGPSVTEHGQRKTVITSRAPRTWSSARSERPLPTTLRRRLRPNTPHEPRLASTQTWNAVQSATLALQYGSWGNGSATSEMDVQVTNIGADRSWRGRPAQPYDGKCGRLFREDGCAATLPQSPPRG